MTALRRLAAPVAECGILVGAVVGCAAVGNDAGQSRVEQPALEAADAYRDGVYEARGWYGSLPSHHDVTLTVEGGRVVDVSISTPAENEISLGYQTRFAETLPGAIVGRDLDEIEVDRLAGSSGCSEGFMAALALIREEARG